MIRPTALGLCLLLLGCAPKSGGGRLAFEVDLPPEGLTEGARSAEISIVEFGSFQCPYCRAFQDSIFPTLSRAYIATGSVRFRFVSIDTLSQFVRLSAWANCQALSVGLDAALRAAFEVALDHSFNDNHPLAVWGPPTDKDERCLQAYIGARLRDARAAEHLGVRRVPTLLVGIESPPGHVVGWIVEGLRDTILTQTIIDVQQRVTTAGWRAE